ncbi:MAG: hypothetical protein ABIE94_05165 [archaeon]
MVKKGQAALEFLTTYGWAFLVILVMIGALAYFGVLNPQNRLPEKCFVGPGFGCTDQTGTSGATSTVKAKVINNLGADATIGNLTIDSSSPVALTLGATGFPGCTVAGGPPPAIYTLTNCNWKANEIKELVFTGAASSLNPGDRASVVFSLKLKPSNSDYVKTASGEVVARVI